MNEFDHRPDPVLGDALRDFLSADDDAAFAHRVIERLPHTITRDSWWDVLSGWARPGLAAAVAALAVLTTWTLGDQPEALPVDEPVAAAETLSAGTLLASEALPEFDLEMVLGEERINE